MSIKELKKLYNLTERAAADVLLRQINLIKNIKELKTFIDAVPEIYLILNSFRQIVFANKALYNFIGNTDENRILGLRPGEVIGCQNAYETPDGCGNSDKCEFCGALNATLSSLDGQPSVQEARWTTIEKGDALDFRVWTVPYPMGNEQYVIFTMTDISDEKRRKVIERVFFHDIMNTVGSLRGFAQLISESPEEISELKDVFLVLSEKLIDEINYQRQLSLAEKNELLIELRKINSIAKLKDIQTLYINQQLTRGQTLVLDASAESIDFISDTTLLRRVLLNMTKNAVEASGEGDTITIGCYKKDDKINFWVNNPGFMPQEIQLQIFKRSFSTKGSGRGLGTYSIKLLTERYLQGTVSFVSTEEAGTTFTASYPLELQV